MAVTKNISLDYQDVIVLGRRGENEAVDIVWDISPLIAEFGGGTALVLAKRATDESAYPVTLTEQTDTTLTWTVSSVDSCVIGVGKVQLFWYVGNVLAKSFMWRTFVGDDITGMVGDPPEAYESWLEHLAEMGADILNDAKDEVKNAEAWAVGERGGEPVVDGDETYHNNAKYWSGVSSDYAGNAESSADAAEQSAGDAAHQVELAEAQVTLAEAQVALAQQKVEDAAAQVALAEAQANAAAGSASDASGYALAASGYASDANTYKGQAYTSAQNAAQSASDAAGYALAASGSATDANTYKGQAQGFANAASGYADNASTYANNASGYADAASDSADDAAASATEAAGYVASLVNGKAGVLEDSATGDVVSIVPDKSVGKLYKAEVSLSPIQSLNGYDHPWAAGAGKNKLAPWITSQTLNDIIWTANADGSAKASGTANGSSQPFSLNIVLPNGSYIISGCPSGGGSSTYFIRVLAYNSGGTLVDNWSDYGSGASFTIDSTIDHIRVFASVNNGVTAPSGTWYPMIRLSSVADASFAPYSNLCPISGHTGATLYKTGKNLLPFDLATIKTMNTSWSWSGNVYTAYGVSFTVNDDGTVTASGTATATAQLLYCKFIPVRGVSYVINGSNGGSNSTYRIAFVFRDANNGYIGEDSEQDGDRAMSIPSGTHHVDIYVRVQNGYAASNLVFKPMVRRATEANATYEPYNGNQYTSSFGQTVYGGTFDFVSGKLVVTQVVEVIDGTQALGNNGTLSYGGVQVVFTPTQNKKLAPSAATQNEGLLSNRFASDVAVTTGLECHLTGMPTNGNIYINMPAGVTTAADAKTWFTSNPTQVAFLLATPVEIDLTPEEVETLLGLNNVWSDGEMSVDYAADLKTYIDNKIAAAVAALS